MSNTVINLFKTGSPVLKQLRNVCTLARRNNKLDNLVLECKERI